MRWAVVAMAPLLLPYSAGAQPPKAPTLDDVGAAWHRRQGSIKGFRFAWSQAVTYPKGAYSEMNPDAAAAGGVVPGAELTLEQRGVLVTEQDKARLEFHGQAYSAPAKRFVDTSFTAIYDGQTGIHVRPGVETGVAVASLNKTAPPSHLNSTNTVVALRALRPASKLLSGWDVDQYEIRAVGVLVDSTPCVELQPRVRPQGGTSAFWLDPARDFLLVRSLQTSSAGAFSAIQYDISYKQSVSGLWVPSAWTSFRKGRTGQTLLTARATVTECEIDRPVPASTFDTTPPPNSRVNETDAKGHSENYIVRPDGTRRNIVRGEESLDFKTLAGSEPGEALRQPVNSWRRQRLMILGASALILGIAGLACIAAQRRWRAAR